MKSSVPRYDKDVVKSAAAGHWNEILVHIAGIDPSVPDGEKYPCTNSGGTARISIDYEEFAESGQWWLNDVRQEPGA